MVFYRRKDDVDTRRKSVRYMVGVAERAVFKMIGMQLWLRLRLRSVGTLLGGDLNEFDSLSRTDFYPGLRLVVRHQGMRDSRRQCSEQDRAAGDPCSKASHGGAGSHVR